MDNQENDEFFEDIDDDIDIIKDSIVDNAEHIEFDDDSKQEHLTNFKKISTELTNIENFYKECLSDIKNEDYTQIEIDNCVGYDYHKV